jgi:hypothetical protein
MRRVLVIAQDTHPNTVARQWVIESVGRAAAPPDTIHLMMKMEYQAAQAADATRRGEKQLSEFLTVTGIESVTSAGQARLQEHFANPLDELPYQYFSSSLEEVPIRVSLAVRYTYK